MNRPIVEPRVGDLVDGHRVTNVYYTGKVELEGHPPVHISWLKFDAGSDRGASFTIINPLNR